MSYRSMTWDERTEYVAALRCPDCNSAVVDSYPFIICANASDCNWQTYIESKPVEEIVRKAAPKRAKDGR